MMTDIGKRRKIRSIIKHYPNISEQEMNFLVNIIKERKIHLIVNQNHPIFLKDESKYTNLMEKLTHIERQLVSMDGRAEHSAREIKEFFVNNS
ncbi:hypothetical protein [Paenibacillus sp. J2TS4]|uniref:hypothetical protein n=1 Tax=Paenibacillus sp. J2TS4 TaxID=2807194 RepID=UPI001B03AFD8|nr:hypothetical protein [Paenibacillus sp. J2TS4]GIP34173.1 hypothetical protein J2TS4_33830 [Paenibacillus sp. J2TS4]